MLGSYVDIEALLIHWAKTVLGLANVTTEYPTNAIFVMPLFVVERFGGSDSTITLDVCHVDIDVYAADRASAKANAETIRAGIRTRLPGYVWQGTTISRTATISAPSHAPFDSRAAVRRITAAYQIHAHQFAGV